eukprot:scaffold22572_cov50-Attheya_sp.AAC.1
MGGFDSVVAKSRQGCGLSKKRLVYGSHTAGHYINHALMYRTLRKYGVPPQLCDVIKILYDDAIVMLKVGTAASRSPPYTVGVKQGGTMAPVLFLFLIQAFAEMLEEEWEDAEIDIPNIQLSREQSMTDWKISGTMMHTE